MTDRQVVAQFLSELALWDGVIEHITHWFPAPFQAAFSDGCYRPWYVKNGYTP